MTEPTAPDPNEAEPGEPPDSGAEAEDGDTIPDESTLLGATGVEEEVLAQLARAEAEMSGSGGEESDSTGAQV